MMGELKGLIFGFLIGSLAFLNLVQAQDQTGFISLDCGLPTNDSYIEDNTNLKFISDATYIDSGESKSLSSTNRNTYLQHFWYVRSFPQGSRNCYNISIVTGTKYLIRTTFLYGNYDGKNEAPQFELYFGADYWYTVRYASDYAELIHVPAKNVDICLINTGHGTPFISSIELRPLPGDLYPAVSGSSLNYSFRADIGPKDSLYRFDYDVYDRIWPSYINSDWTELSTSLDVIETAKVPFNVLRTAATTKDGSFTMDLSYDTSTTSSRLYMFMYFAEVVKLQANQFRGFNIIVNEELWYGPVIPKYLSANYIYSIRPSLGGNFKISLVGTENSTLPPIINALEFFTAINFSPLLHTFGSDVDAVKNIKSTYGIKKSWQNDPCFPKAYPWDGLNCSSDDLPRITSLNLSSSGLTGVISSYISNLTMLQTLDLSNNNLTGTIPDIMSSLTNLKVLNLENNMLNGSIPTGLVKRIKEGSLLLSVGGNPKLDVCAVSSCSPGKPDNKNHIVIPIVAAVAGIFIVATIIVVIIFFRKRRQPSTEKPQDNITGPESYMEIHSIVEGSTQVPDSFETKRRQFSYSEVVKMTNDFKRTLGRGGFGTVYHGLIDDIQVAVKVLSTTFQGEQEFERGYQQFQAEVKLLMRVHHKNLTNLVGYFNEGTNIGLIYEYMAKGNLEEHLSESNPKVLTWEHRLQIATDAAQGLEYLHDNCQPPIIHRDVKTTNILLTQNLEAKLADFGLSKIIPIEGGTISTVVAGTPGYLDPDYYRTNRLTEKSDVYSFGVVLLEIITCRPVVTRTQGQDMVHITKWVTSMVANGDIKSIVDPRLKGDYNMNSVWRAVEIGLNCVKMEPERRPTMNQVVAELKGCLAPELSAKQSSPLQSKDSIEMISVTMVNQSRPMAR